MNVNETLAQLDHVDRAIVKLKYENRNLSYAQIGKLLEPSISKQAVETRINKVRRDANGAEYCLKTVLGALEGDVVAAFKSHQHAAVQVIARTMTGANKSWLQYQAATYFLDGLKNSKLSHPDALEVDEVLFIDPNAPKQLPGKEKK